MGKLAPNCCEIRRAMKAFADYHVLSDESTDWWEVEARQGMMGV